jgi:predicted CoA-binding protein
MRDSKERLRDIPEAIAAIDRYRRSDRLRQTLLDALLQQGFTLVAGQLVPPDPSCKDNIRQLYVHL